MKLSKKIQECTGYDEAKPILEKAGARNHTKKLIKESFSLLGSVQNKAIASLKSAFKEMEDDNIADNEINEEELKNNNTGERTTGSEQSTENEEPFSGKGKDSTTGEKPMDAIEGAVNQWSETHPAAGATGIPSGVSAPGAIPPQPAMPPGVMPPNQMAGPPPTGGIPPIQPIQPIGQMDPQMQQYIQSVIRQEMQNYDSQVTTKTKETMGRVVSQLTANSNQQKEVIKKLSQELQETISSKNSMQYDLDYMRKNASASFRETVPILNGFVPGGYGKARLDNKLYSKYDNLTQARAEITEMDKILKSR